MSIVYYPALIKKNDIIKQTNLLVNFLILNPLFISKLSLHKDSLLISNTGNISLDSGSIQIILSFCKMGEAFTQISCINKNWNQLVKCSSLLNANWIKPIFKLHPQLESRESLAKKLLFNSEINPFDSYTIDIFDAPCSWESFINKFNIIKLNLSEYRYSRLISRYDETPRKFYPNVTADDLIKFKIQLSEESTYFNNCNIETLCFADSIRFWNYLQLCQYVTEIVIDTYVLYTHVHKNGVPNGPPLTEAILQSLQNQKYSQYITSNAINILCTIYSAYFDPSRLIKDNLPGLSQHLNQLSADDFIFIVLARTFTSNDSFLATLLTSTKIRSLFSSSQYIVLATNRGGNGLNNSIALTIVSQAETIDQLTDRDFYFLVKYLWEEFPQLLRENKSLREKMTGDRWFYLAKKNVSYLKMIFTHNDLALYNHFTLDQLKTLMIGFDTQSIVVEDTAVFRELLLRFDSSQLQELRNTAFCLSQCEVLKEKFKEIDAIDFAQRTQANQIKIDRTPSRSPMTVYIKPKKKLQAALAASTLLLLAGTASGISAIFIPHILTISIALLAAALVGFAAYAAVNYSRNGFFSNKSERAKDYSDLVIQIAAHSLRGFDLG